jgi:hypothetical protein
MAPVTAQLGFIRPLDVYAKEKPYWLFIGRPEHMPNLDLTNVKTDAVTGIPLRDVRGHEAEYSLDKHGFQYIKHHQTFDAFDDEQRIIDEYLPQVERTIRDSIPYAEKIFVYDWRVRKLASNK